MSFLKSLLKSVSSIFVAGSLSAAAEAQTYPDQWKSYMATRNGQPALILYNVGIGDVLSQLLETNLLIVNIALKDAGSEGFQSNAESKLLFEMDDAFIARIAVHKAHDLGRLTALGSRYVYVATGNNASELGKALVETAKGFGYEATFQVEPDTLLKTYREILSPTADETRISEDEQVLRQLAENGDIAEKVRRVDHWAYFSSREAAEAFAKWAKENGFSNVELVETEGGPDEIVVRSSHEGTMVPSDILMYTSKQDHKARELGGEYDGWESAVMR